MKNIDLDELADIAHEAMMEFMKDPERNKGIHGEPVMIAPIVEPVGDGDRMLVMDDDGTGEVHEVRWWVVDDYIDHLQNASGPIGAFGVWLSKQRRQRGKAWGA